MRTRSAWLTAALAAAVMGAGIAVVATGGLQSGSGPVPARPLAQRTRSSTTSTSTEAGAGQPAPVRRAPTTDEQLARLLPGIPVDRAVDPAPRRAGQAAPLRLAVDARAVPADGSGRGQYIVMLTTTTTISATTVTATATPSTSSSAAGTSDLPFSTKSQNIPPFTAQAIQRAERAGAGVGQRFDDGYAARFTPAQLAVVRADVATAYVEVDQVVQATTTQTGVPWGLDRIDQRALPLNRSYSYALTGAGVKAYVIDTGLRASHSEVRGRVGAGAGFVSDGRGTNDCDGHGTHVSAIIGGVTDGVAKAVTLVPVRVLDCNGEGYTSDVVAGIHWVTTHHTGPSVANMSLGGGASTALDSAVQASVASGVSYAVAAGNELVNPCSGLDAESPARIPEVITVGATQQGDYRDADYSNYGPCLDVFAPGTGIVSAWITSDTARATLSGTSMATPHVTGAVAQYLQTHPGAGPATVQSALIRSATQGTVRNPGLGSPNRLLYVPIVPPSVTVNGTMSGLGARAVLPRTGSYTTQSGGTQTGVLSGPAGTDFDLYLFRWTGSQFAVVAQGEAAGSGESVSYGGPPGTYYWLVVSSGGSGTYSLTTTQP